jgi:hypothetical protein
LAVTVGDSLTYNHKAIKTLKIERVSVAHPTYQKAPGIFRYVVTDERWHGNDSCRADESLAIALLGVLNVCLCLCFCQFCLLDFCGALFMTAFFFFG